MIIAKHLAEALRENVALPQSASCIYPVVPSTHTTSLASLVVSLFLQSSCLMHPTVLIKRFLQLKEKQESV